MSDDNRNITVGKSWPRPATPCDLVPNWEGEFRDFQDWVNFAHKRLTVASDSNGAALSAICVDTLGRRCHNGRDMMRARDEGTFPVRYFFECREGTALDAKPHRHYRHVKRGTTYAVIGYAELQAAQPAPEGAELAVYVGEDGKLWAREAAEFHDGRFEHVPTHAYLTRWPLPQDVIDLVIAAREAWEERGASGDALDRALERFALRVPYANHPDEAPQ